MPLLFTAWTDPGGKLPDLLKWDGMNFKSCFGCSLLLHGALFAITAPFVSAASFHRFDRIEVGLEAAPVFPRRIELEREPVHRVTPPPEPAHPQPSEPPPVWRFYTPRQELPYRPVDSPAAPAVHPDAVETVSQKPVIAAPPVSESDFAVLQYKETVRSYLRKRLNYPQVGVQGTVRLRVLIGPGGTLKEAQVLQSSDLRLTQAALRDAQAASPYPGFPAALKRRHVRYEFWVRYQPE